MNQPYTAAATLLALLMYLGMTATVGRYRLRYAIKAPAVTGHEQFERAHRVQMNTVEQMVFFLPALWLCAVLWSDVAAALAGAVWVIGRSVYAFVYIADPTKRGPAVGVSMLAQFALFLGALAGLVAQLMG